MRARCSGFRYCPNPLGIVTAEQLDKLEFCGQWPLAMRARCSTLRYSPAPLGIVTVEQLEKLEFVNLNLFGSKQTPHPVSLHDNPTLHKKHSFLHSKEVYQV